MIRLQLLAVLIGGALIQDAERRLYEDVYAHLQVSECLVGLGIVILGLAPSLW